MSEVKAFRCPKCLKLLFKFDVATGKVEYRISTFAFRPDDEGNTKYVACPKCKTECEITKTGLTVVTLELSRHGT